MGKQGRKVAKPADHHPAWHGADLTTSALGLEQFPLKQIRQQGAERAAG